MNTTETSFQVSVKGDFTGNNWVGSFRMKTRLSYREALKKDQKYRELLGPDPTNNASDESKSIAESFSFLETYLVESPSWWRDKGNGLDMEDNNVAPAVYAEAIKALGEVVKARNAQAEAARQALEKAQPAE